MNKLNNLNYLRPRIVISKCLEFDACRYDGQMIKNKFIKNLKKFIDFIPVCPEVEIGMGIPRDTIRIIKNNKERLLFQPETGNDFSKKMDLFSKKFLSNSKGWANLIFCSYSGNTEETLSWLKVASLTSFSITTGGKLAESSSRKITMNHPGPPRRSIYECLGILDGLTAKGNRFWDGQKPTQELIRKITNSFKNNSKNLS